MSEHESTGALLMALREWAQAAEHGCRTGGDGHGAYAFVQLHHRPQPQRPERQLTLRARLVEGQPVLVVDLPDATPASARTDDATAPNRVWRAPSPGAEPPLRDDTALCEGCGRIGTVGVAARFSDDQTPVDVHRFCAACWPEQSARYQARWAEEVRRANEGLDPSGTAVTPPTSTMFGADTWHGTLDLVRDLEQRMHPSPPPEPQALARVAAEIARLAATRDGPMPREVVEFIRRYGTEPN